MPITHGWKTFANRPFQFESIFRLNDPPGIVKELGRYVELTSDSKGLVLGDDFPLIIRFAQLDESERAGNGEF